MIELQGKFGKDCKIFTNAIENEAIGTIQNILNNPVTTGVPVRIMPDTHQGVDIVIDSPCQLQIVSTPIISEWILVVECCV